MTIHFKSPLWFQLTRPRGTRHCGYSRLQATALFQLTRPRGTRHAHTVLPGRDRRVSTHASAGDATRASLLRAVQRLVSTHASAGDAMRRQSLTARSMSFQLTRPRGTRLVITRRIFVLIAVSTHASAGDATKSMPSLNPSRLFQLTRPRGTRPRFRGLYSAACSFNSRVRGGRDSCNLSITGSTIVSTHASAGDATA